MHRGWLHQDVKLTVNKVIYIGRCGCCFKEAHSTLARYSAVDGRMLPGGPAALLCLTAEAPGESQAIARAK